MLAGLPRWVMRRTPPCFWAQAVPNGTATARSDAKATRQNSHGWPSQPLDKTDFIVGSPPDVSCERRFFHRTLSWSACLALAGTIPKTTRAVTSPSLGSLAQCPANTLQIEDLGSTNGTSVDGAVVIAGILRPLQAGTRLKIGDIELSVGDG